MANTIRARASIIARRRISMVAERGGVVAQQQVTTRPVHRLDPVKPVGSAVVGAAAVAATAAQAVLVVQNAPHSRWFGCFAGSVRTRRPTSSITRVLS